MFRLGVSDFLLKPYRPEALCQAVEDMGESRSTQVNTKVLARRLETMREQFRRRSEEIRLLSEIGRVVVGLGDLDAILRRVVEAAAFMTDAEEANIYLAEPGSKGKIRVPVGVHDPGIREYSKQGIQVLQMMGALQHTA